MRKILRRIRDNGEFVLAGRLLIGRTPDCGLQLLMRDPDPYHAVITVVGSEVLLEDLGSTSGTFLNDVRISSAAKLRPGDRIRFDTEDFIFVIEAMESLQHSAAKRPPSEAQFDAAEKSAVFKSRDELRTGRDAGRLNWGPVYPPSILRDNDVAGDDTPRLQALRRSIREIGGPAPPPEEQRVWFGTDRCPKYAGDNSAGFSDKPDSHVHYGSCVVEVPLSHRYGSLGSPLLLRIVNRMLRIPIDRPLRLLAIEDGTRGSFVADINEKLMTLEATRREVCLFIHGYNVSFEGAALRAAQIGKDLAIPGPMLFFSWPSRGQAYGYTADMRTVDRSFRRLLDFIDTLTEIPAVEAVNVIAHSMGNQLLSRAAELLAARGGQGFRLGHVVLAAPDVDRDSFCEVAAAYTELRSNQNRRTTLYWNRSDMALALSKVINGAPSAGIVGRNIPAVDSILWTNRAFRLDWLGHGYFAAAAPVMADMEDLLLRHYPPEARRHLKPVPTDIPQYWHLRPV